MQALFAPHLVLKVLNGVGDENMLTVNSGILEGCIQYPTRRTYEGSAGEIFLVARLLSHKHEISSNRPFARNYLNSVLVERTAFAVRLGPSKA
jgi:hypothetical protein